MQFYLDQSSARPVYQQIIDNIKREIALGHLTKGQKLPTVRRLAAQLIINPNTIAKAYRQLESEGIISTRPGSGAFVAQLNSTLSHAVRQKIITEKIELLAVDAIHMQIDRPTLQSWLTDTLDRFQFETAQPVNDSEQNPTSENPND
ncbi:MAG: GntR family transcriptional regulator [Sedimentisphaerales bacterium]|nr:GntR family transcriptional regulator [Sedimentisphaerales bacterium]